MKIKKLLFLFFLFSVWIFLAPKIVFSQNLSQRKKTENSFVILKNDNNILPFIKIDTLNIFVIQKNYQAQILNSSINRYKISEKTQTNANLLIIPVFHKTSSEINLPANQKYILCLFGYFPENKTLLQNAEAIIYSPLQDSLTIDYCGQLIFGAFSVNNKLDTNLSAQYSKGYGLELQGGIRFKYTIPAEIGLDSSFIFNKIDSIANFAIKAGATPGCQIFAAVNQKVFFMKSYGYHTYDSIIPVKNSDLYDLASITKIAATAPCMMLLTEQEKININDKFSKYWRAFRHSNKKDLTLIDAMCHQGRLTAWIPFWKNTLQNGQLDEKIFSQDSSKKYPVKVANNLYIKRNYKKEIFKEIKKSPVLKEKKYRYSDLSFYIYPQIIKKLTRQDIQTCLNENFYSKLGANSLCYNPIKYYSLDQIVPTEYDSLFRKQLIHGYVHDEGAAMLGGVSGHAGLFGNANDLAKLVQMYLNYGTYGGIKYIDSTILKTWTSYQFADQGNRRGIIFDKPLLEHKEWGTPSPYASGESFGHSGFTGTFVWSDPQNGLLFVFLSNRVYPTRRNKKLLHYNIRTNIHSVLYEAIESKK